MIVATEAVRDRLRLPLTVPDADVDQLRDAAEEAVLPLCTDGTDTAAAREAVLGLCKDIWAAARHTYDSQDFAGFAPAVTSNMVHRYSALLAAVRDTGSMVR